MWYEVDHYNAPLYAYMMQNRIGRRGDTPSVYIVRNGTSAVYVGKTVRGVYYRLWRHIQKVSDVGLWMIQHEHDKEAPQYKVEVISVNGDIDEAEMHTISTEDPLLNIVRYKNKLALPPRSRCLNSEIDLKGWAEYNGSIFERHDVYWQVRLEKQVSEDLEVLNRIYSRAYRDPNHPDIRDEKPVRNSIIATDVFYLQRVRQYMDGD